MSRTGLSKIEIPTGVEIKIENKTVTVKSNKGEMTKTFAGDIIIENNAGIIKVKRENDNKFNKMMHGTTRSIIKNMIEGLTNGFSKELEIVGLGYKAAMQGKTLVLNVGYSHEIKFESPEGITIETPSNTEIKISGFDKELVGEIAAKIRAFKKPEPYKGKGIKYKDEYIIKKEGKKQG